MAICWLVMIVAQAGPPMELPPLPDSSPMEVRVAPPMAPPPERLWMGLADLEAIALRHNPTLVQASERIEQARGNVDQASRYPNPFASWNSQSLNAGGTMGEQGAFVQQPIVTGGKIRINRARYEVDVEIARWGLVEQRYRVLNGVRLRYWQILAEQRLLEHRTNLVRMAEEVMGLTREKVETGHASDADLFVAENEVEHLRLDRDRLEDSYRNSWREVGAYLGAPGIDPVPLRGNLEGPITPLTWESSLAYLMQGSPEIKVAELRILRAQRDLKREEVEPIPNLILRGGAAYDPDNEEMIGIARVYIDLPFWDRNQGNIVTARHALTDVRYDLERVRLSVEQRLSRRYNQYQTSLANVRRFREEILPRARSAFELYVEEFREEEEGYSRVQSALGAYTDSLVKYEQQSQELRNAETAILGMLLIEDNIEVTSPMPMGGGVPSAPAGGGAPVGGRPTRLPN